MIRTGCAFRAGLIPWLWDKGGLVDTFEHSIDAFVGAGEDGLRAAETCADMGDFSLHSIGLTLGSPAARARPKHLEEIRDVLRVMGASELSDHLAYTRVDDLRLHDFAPLWRVEEQLDLFAENVEWVQDQVGARLALENIASLFDPGGEMTGAEFANEVSRRTGCALLLDISNVLIDEANGFCDAELEFGTFDLHAVVQVHLGGGEYSDGLMWDAHSRPVPLTDIEWLERLLPQMPNCGSVIVERDERLQDGAELVDDLRAVRAVVDRGRGDGRPGLTLPGVAPGFDAQRVLASPSALAALEDLGEVLRSVHYDNEPFDAGSPAERQATRLALGHRVSAIETPPSVVEALVGAGAADLVAGGDDLVPRFAIFAADNALVLVPRDGGLAADRVYFGHDSLWLAEVAAALEVGRGRYADLGTGAGGVAAMLAGRHDEAVVTDLVPRTAACAAITMCLNRRSDGRPAGEVCVTDVAAALRPGSFSLVTANPPWVPNDGEDRRFYADGGTSGFELPRRFVVEAAQLLAPGGASAILALDAMWRDESRPLASLAGGLRRLGYEAAIVPAPPAVWGDLEDSLLSRFPAMTAAGLVALLVRRPLAG